MEFAIGIIVGAICMFYCANRARQAQKTPVVWAFIGLLLGPIGALICYFVCKPVSAEGAKE